jgi:hypothetical protein
MSLLKTMIKHTAGGQEASAGGETPSLPPQPPQPAIYVSTGLDIHDIEDARDWPEDREIDGTLCRRLSPEYFAWLRSRMVTAQAAHKAGKLPEDAWNTLRQRFNALQELAIREFGKESLQEVLQSFSSKNYQPPALRPESQVKPVEVPKKDWIYPGNQAWKCKQPVTSQAVAKVDAIREEAMARAGPRHASIRTRAGFGFPAARTTAWSASSMAIRRLARSPSVLSKLSTGRSPGVPARCGSTTRTCRSRG